jgi:hypothetical protein
MERLFQKTITVQENVSVRTQRAQHAFVSKVKSDEEISSVSDAPYLHHERVEVSCDYRGGQVVSIDANFNILKGSNSLNVNPTGVTL